jgi:iron complex transport system ATP-binding protein
MSFIDFEDVTFAYTPVEGDLDAEGKQIIPPVLFDHFTASLPSSFVSIVGPNACGKSTLMLLASGRLKPLRGTIRLFGKDLSTIHDENEKNLLSSFIYQNMEFEQDEKLADLLMQVYEAGGHAQKSGDFYKDIISVFELGSITARKLNGLSKGEIQRTLLAFSVLYGSKSIFMDEPMFAMEQKQKESCLDFLKHYSKEKGIPVYISMHELELSRKYAQDVLLIYPNRDMTFGSPDEVLVPEDLEKAYGIPAALLKDSENLTRKNLKELSEQAVQNT